MTNDTDNMTRRPVVLYTTGYCPYCIGAKRLLDRKGVDYEEIRVDQNPERRPEMVERSRRHTVPQIFIGEHHVGGHDDLVALDRAGELKALLEGASAPAG